MQSNGHAGDGNLHTRPILDLQKRSDVTLMERLAEEVFELVMEMKGSVSGEHGDGRLRTPLLPDFLWRSLPAHRRDQTALRQE